MNRIRNYTAIVNIRVKPKVLSSLKMEFMYESLTNTYYLFLTDTRLNRNHNVNRRLIQGRGLAVTDDYTIKHTFSSQNSESIASIDTYFYKLLSLTHMQALYQECTVNVPQGAPWRQTTKGNPPINSNPKGT